MEEMRRESFELSIQELFRCKIQHRCCPREVMRVNFIEAKLPRGKAVQTNTCTHLALVVHT